MIEIKDLEKTYGFKKVLNGVSFTAQKGEITCLIGINGSGKTTIMNAIMALTAFKGDILMDGEEIKKEQYEKIAFVPDTMTMMSHMRISETFEFMQDFYQNWNQKRADELLRFFRLDKESRISQLSKGNKAKINLLLGLAIDVDYILMDEPFSGIDVFTREEIANVFTSHLIEDRGVIVTTHEIGDIEHLVDKAILLDGGKVIQDFYAEEKREVNGQSIIDVMREVYMK